ncbi:MAG: tRNA (guanosine(46)-N7)-methyltransferase TrmB [Aeriscardovia sp.]|nr:tRNA (guanosine(46)-N7)-methyltransferase TrmB [Aeriscardovia sp.]
MDGTTENQAQAQRRTIVSFVRRNTRLTPKLQKAWDKNADRYLLDIPRQDAEHDVSVATGFRLDKDFQRSQWGRVRPLIVEVGTGQGENIAAAAAARPDCNFLAVEVFDQGIAHTLSRCQHQALSNLRIAQADAAQLFATAFPDGSLEEVWTYFPDPWPKMKHHKRRLIQAPFAADVLRCLRPEGLWRIATDIDDYALQVHETLDFFPGFANVGAKNVSLATEHVGKGNADEAAMLPHALFRESERYEGRIVTSFERKGLEAGHTVRDLTYRKTALTTGVAAATEKE